MRKGGLLRVLVADDSHLHRQIMLDALEAAGHEVAVARDGIEAARLALSEPIDLFVLDVEMPGMNGYQVAHLLKDDPVTSQVPLVFLTSQSRPGARFWGLTLGAVQYLSKAASRADIMSAIEQALEGSPGRVAREAVEPMSAERLLERLAGVLDRRLFETVVTYELASLVHDSHDYLASMRKALEALSRVADYDVASMVLFATEECVTVVGRTVDKSVVAAAEQAAIEVLPTRCRPTRSGLHKSVGNRARIAGERKQVTATWSALLPSGDGILGSVAFVTTDPRGFPEPATKALGRIVPTLAMVADNLGLYEQMRLQAITDGLTHTYNHRYFQELLQAECKRSMRSRAPLGLLMADLDHFKQVNDQYGHQCGDQVLAAVAKRIYTQLRQSDTLARYGGEEFAVILPDTELSGAMKVAERVRSAVGIDPFDIGTQKGTLTISVGVADASGEDLQEPTALVARADAALYEAKRGGRDKVVADMPDGKGARHKTSTRDPIGRKPH